MTRDKIHIVPEDEVNSKLEESLNKIVSMNNKARTPVYSKYDYEYLDTAYPYISGYAAGQPSGGVKFSDGGSFYWTEGGSQESVSVTIGGSVVSVSSTLGKVSDKVTGYVCNVPTKTKFYRLYVKKKMKVQKMAVYGYPIGQSTRQFLYYSYPSAVSTIEFNAIAQ